MEANKKIALVTGGNKGIGLEICKKLASNGVDVILTARDEKRGKEATEELIRDYGLTNIIFHQLDVTDRSSIESLASFVKNQFGKLDILVNNAAASGADEFTKPIDEKLPQQERAAIFLNNLTDTYEKAVKVFNTNYYGVMNMMEVFLPLVQLSNFGKIVNVSTTVAQLQKMVNDKVRNELMDIDNLTMERIEGLAKSFLKSVEDNTMEENRWVQGAQLYRVSKILMNAYTRVFAKSYPSTVTISCVNPGHVKTDLNLNTGSLTVSEGAEGPVMVALAERGLTGQFYDRTQISTF